MPVQDVGQDERTAAQARELKRWQADVGALVDEIEGWADRRGWATHREPKRVRESKLGGEYEVPYLAVRSPQGRVHVDPGARYVAGKATGRVDLEAWPTMREMKLVRVGGKWALETDSGVPWPEPWGEETFVSLVNALLFAEY